MNLNNLGNMLPQLIYILPVILISLSVHEFAHGYVAFKQGDYTARNQGRLTLNPLVHLDPIGTLMIIFSSLSGFGFGWAKPVPFNPSYFRDWKKGTRYVGLAGPVSNFIIAFFAMLIYKILLPIILVTPDGMLQNVLVGLGTFMLYFQIINISLGVFNLLPVPPLDGSKIFGSLLPDNLYGWMLQNEQYIGYGFFAIIIFFPGVLYAVIGPIRDGILNGMNILLTPVDMIMKLFY